MCWVGPNVQKQQQHSYKRIPDLVFLQIHLEVLPVLSSSQGDQFRKKRCSMGTWKSVIGGKHPKMEVSSFPTMQELKS